jgi:hypothetical protein
MMVPQDSRETPHLGYIYPFLVCRLVLPPFDVVKGSRLRARPSTDAGIRPLVIELF